jgi:DNA-binding response OmpR family regulator
VVKIPITSDKELPCHLALILSKFSAFSVKFGAMRLLVVEDEKKIADSLKKGLEQEAYAVDVAYDGEYGYDLASTEDYDLIVLDLMLPGMDGMTLCKKLREEGKSTPVLMLTAKGELEDKVEGLNIGADDYLVKPFAFAELLARIKALARRPKKSLSSVLKVGDLSLDTNSYKVTRAGKEVMLSKKEFALLAYLLKNKGRVLTKEQIINNVWNFDADILPNTVEVYIGYLRDKIDRPFKEPPLIKTVRGFGYKVEDD